MQLNKSDKQMQVSET